MDLLLNELEKAIIDYVTKQDRGKMFITVTTPGEEGGEDKVLCVTDEN